MERSTSLDLRQERLPAGSMVRNLHVSKVSLTVCSADAVITDRPRIENCSFRRVRLATCHLGTTVFRDCTFDGVRSSYLDTYNALFLHCALKGEIKGVNFGIRPDLNDPGKNAALRADNDELLAGATYCLDVRDARLTGVLFQGEEIVRRVVFRSAQCAIFRGTADLGGQLKSALTALPPGDVRKSIGRANVFDGEGSALVALPVQDSKGLLEELARLLASYRVDVRGEPMATV